MAPAASLALFALAAAACLPLAGAAVSTPAASEASAGNKAIGLGADDACSSEDGGACGLNAAQVRSSKLRSVRYEPVGAGGCRSAAEKYPRAMLARAGVLAPGCRRMCSEREECAAYEHCSGPNCGSVCKLFAFSDHISASNGFPNASCLEKIYS